MKPNNLKKFVNLRYSLIKKTPLATNVFNELLDRLFSKNSLVLLTQSLAVLCLFFGLWAVSSHALLISWFLYMLAVFAIGYALTLFYRQKKKNFKRENWLIFMAIFTLLLGIGWGFAGSVLIPSDDLVHQTFVIIFMFSITAISLVFFSPIIFIYPLFLFPAFIPFEIWLFAQGETYFLLGIFGLIYIPIICASSYYLNQFLIDALKLRYKNENLDTLNQLLEKRVNNRTEELERTLAVTKSTLESTADGILVIDIKGNIGYHNHKFLDMWKLSSLLIDKSDLSILIEKMSAKIKNPDEFHQHLEEINNNPSREIFNEIVMSNNLVFEWCSKPHLMHNLIVGHAWNFRDITSRKQMERQLIYQTNYDILTGLPNKTLLYDRIKQGIVYAKRYQTQLYLLFLDIDNFKLINDNFGHNLGDILLQEIAQRLRNQIRESDTVSRFGGDEFIILFISNNYSDILKLSQKILNKIREPTWLANQEIIVTASIGASIYPNDGKDAATLLKNADMAMYLAKNLGRNNLKLYDETMKENTESTLTMQTELRNALTNKEFFLLYQPIYDLKTGQISAVEALVRWNHPTKGIIYPLQFIPAAEETSLIIILGEWIFRNACLQNKIWQKMGLRPIPIAINVSSIQMMRENFADMTRQIIRDSELAPQYIEIEITESILMDDKQHNLLTMQRLKEMGVHLTIDDFGTGYSSLNYLHEFPVHKLKIDQSFIRDCQNSNGASIIDAIISMGHGLKLKVLAEGIETIEQLRLLKDSGCDEGQGFFYGQPMSAEAFAEYLN